MCVALLKKLFVSVKGVVSNWVLASCCVFVGQPCPCLRLMPRPLRGWHWTAVPFWTIALARVSDNNTSSVLSAASSLFLSCSDRTVIHWEVTFFHMVPWFLTKSMSCPKWKLLFGVWPALRCSDSAYFRAHWVYMITLVPSTGCCSTVSNL